ncbi:thaumatin [Phycomyces nitens]|nr:thaumatin [Phycomyces nitens]
MLFSVLSTIALLASSVVAAPAERSVKPYVLVENNCDSKLYVGNTANGQLYGSSIPVNAGGSHKFVFDNGWAGRIWARKKCSGNDCTYAGIGAPASLAEFYFKGPTGNDFYDISFVDGYNLPLSITPINGHSNGTTGESNAFLCGSSVCSTLPSCPKGFESKDAEGNVIGCMSACTKFGTPEICCTGQYDTEFTCSGNEYAEQVKAQCPNAYSWAFDDSTSAYMCNAEGYKVTFC